MGLFDHFPYTNVHELNLDWIMEQLLTLKTTIEQFVSINALKYADPIQWNITSQYEKNTIVIDPLTGTAYISVQPVPSGVAITNTDYWTVVFDLGSFVVRAAKNFTDKFEEETTLTASFPSSVNDWIIWGDVLYRVISPIVAGDQYVIGSNIEHFTAEDVIGHIEDLNTTDKSNLVAAINELVQALGDLNDLNTTDKSNLVEAINEVLNDLTTFAANPFTYYVNTVADLVTGDFSTGSIIFTKGYYTENDRGSAEYIIRDTTPSGYYETLNNGKYAELIIKPVMSFEMFGAHGDNSVDDSAAIQAAITYGSNIMAMGTYRIENVIEMNSTGDLTPELGTDQFIIITGRGKNVSLTTSASTLTGIDETEATFIFDGGYFHLRGTSRVDFKNCVFMGSKDNLKTDTAFEITAPGRKFNITASTFANLKKGIHCSADTRWCGENIYDGLYFILCEYGIHYENTDGGDSIITNCIGQGNCDYFIWIEDAIGILFSGNHDYTKYGTHLYYGATIVNNYFDGLGKLHIKTSYDRSGSLTNKYSSHGCAIVGNIFLMHFHDTDITGNQAMIIIESSSLTSAVITNNVLHGGADYANICLLDMANVTMSANNIIENNTGLGLNYLFKDCANGAINWYFNDYSGYNPDIVVDPSYTDVRKGCINCKGGFIVFVRINNPSSDIANGIQIQNIPPGGTVNSIIFHHDNNNDLSVSTNSSLIQFVSSGNKFTVIFFINIGTTELSEMLLRI